MLSYWAGSWCWLSTVAVFIAFLPRGGKMYRFVDTEWEPYVGVAFCSAHGARLHLDAVREF